MKKIGRVLMVLVVLAATSLTSLLPSEHTTLASEPRRPAAVLSEAGPLVTVPGSTPAIRFPSYYKDANGLALALCLGANCLATAADLNPANPDAPGEAFWWEANVIGMSVGGGSIDLVMAMEAAFANGAPEAGGEMTFGRIRIRASGLTPGATYTVIHPFTTRTFTASLTGTINDTSDIGCFPVVGVTTCDFNLALSSGIGPFLAWDPAVAPAPPTGFIGDALTPHKVVGSPTGNNFFRVTGPEGTFTRDTFVVQGQKAVEAVNDTATVPAGATGVPINVLSNDIASATDTLTVSSVTQPTNGSSTNATTHVTYTNNGTAGTDAFNYVASNGTVTDTATITLTVHAGNAAPVAVTDAMTVAITSTATTINVLSNDTDANSDLTFVSAVTQGTKGTAAIGTAGRNVTYDPNGVDAGADSFTYTVSDGVGTSVGTVNIVVDRAPVATNDTATVTANTSSNIIDVLANDTDADLNPLTVTAVTQSISGTVAIGTLGANVRYTPNPNFGGTDVFTYTVSDGALTSLGSVTVTVNRFPVAASDAITVSINSANNVLNVLTNDSDPDGNTITVSALTQPANGLASVGPGAANIIYSPNAGFFGSDPFTYSITDGLLVVTTTATVTVNRPPVAVGDTARAPQNSITNTISVLANDSDPDTNPITVTAVTQPAHGTASVGAGGADVRYAPGTAFVGDDTFTYTISDGHLTASETVTVTVHRGPSVVNDSFRVLQDSLNNILDVLANDRDPDGDAISVTSATQGTRGTVSLGVGGANVVYSPNPGFAGSDSFTYTVSDGQVAMTGTVSVLVNRAPLAANDSSAVQRNSTGNPINVLANDSDPDGNTITVTAVTQSANGTVSVGPAGLNVIYSPRTGFAGIDAFTYTISDGLQTANASVTVTVPDQRLSNSPPTAVNDTVSVPRNSINFGINALANDVDSDNDALRVINVGTPSNGLVAVGSGGAILFYTPRASFSGSDSFTYTISDGLLVANGTVNVTVPANTAPTAVTDSLSVPSNSSNNPLPVLGNDTDPDADPILVTSVAAASNGSVSIGPGGTTVIYTPNPGFTGTDTFSYGISDGALGGSANVSVVVHALNNPPVALDDTATVAVSSGANTLSVLTNDSDPDGDPVAVSSVTQGANGTVSVAAGRRSIVYTPRDNFSGVDTFTYIVIDGALTSPSATVTVNVSGVKYYLPILPHLDFAGW